MIALTGVGSDFGWYGAEQSSHPPSIDQGDVVFIVAVVPNVRDDDESAGSAGPAPRSISASTGGVLGASSCRTSSARRHLPTLSLSHRGRSSTDLPRYKHRSRWVVWQMAMGVTFKTDPFLVDILGYQGVDAMRRMKTEALLQRPFAHRMAKCSGFFWSGCALRNGENIGRSTFRIRVACLSSAASLRSSKIVQWQASKPGSGSRVRERFGRQNKYPLLASSGVFERHYRAALKRCRETFHKETSKPARGRPYWKKESRPANNRTLAARDVPRPEL
jgi:hypothetical protein